MFVIEIIEKETARTARVALPTSRFVVNDCMDKARIFDETTLRIHNCTDVPELKDANFKEQPTLEELNFLAKRIKEIRNDRTRIFAYRALLNQPFDTINEVINRTFGLDTIPVLPCKDAEEYGKIVLENDMLEELEEIPEELDHLLDLEKIGKLMQEHENGVFIDGYYAAANCYDPVPVYDEELSEPMEDWVFRLEVATPLYDDEDITEKETEILTLPATEERLKSIADSLGIEQLEDSVWLKFDTAIPQINDELTSSMDNIALLNSIALEYSEMLRQETAKFKAVLEHEMPRDLQGVDYLLSVLDEYEFDNTIIYPSDFGKKYLSNFLPESFDKSLLADINFYPLGDSIIRENNCGCNDYGFISKRGGHLYTMTEASRQEQSETHEPEMSL